MTDTPWRLLALPPLGADVLRLLFDDPRLEIVVPEERTPLALAQALPHADVVLGDYTGQLRLADPGPRVVAVQMPSVGTDALDVEAITAAGVPVANCAGTNASAVAEWCVAAVLERLRRLGAGDRAVRAGGWPQLELRTRELAGRPVGVVGLGDIGARVARLLRAFDADVRYWSRTRRPDTPDGPTYLPLPELLATSDVVVVVVALTPETVGLVDPRALRPGSVLVNAARGAVLVEDAVPEAVAAGVELALDVFAVEPLPADSPLRALDGVLLSPHAAGSSQEAAGRVIAACQANVRRVLDGEPLRDVVNGLDPLVRRR